MMKRFILNQNFVGILLLTAVVLCNTSCSKDDDNDKKIAESMLESLDKTKWVFDGIGFPAIYLKFNDTNTDFIELWAAIAEMECYIYGSSEDDNTLQIIENSKTKLVIKATESSEYYSLMIITYVGDKLNIKDEYYVNGVLDDTDVLVFNKTSVNLDNLNLCDLGFEFKSPLVKQSFSN
ncbi:hypothetical protein [Namhaeicola litoreus]|uniref:DUF4252 domain-containing protein n=1 Tax=Namhaeicola litoreus TaxID=1052145 RepID=A0ABW3Y0H5_9FLAO